MATGAEVLGFAKGAARVFRLIISSHASDRMAERSARYNDVRRAVMTASGAAWSDEHKSWKLSGGVDLDSDRLDVCVVIKGHDTLVVTIIGGK